MNHPALLNLEKNVPMQKRSSWRTGGSAHYFFEPKTLIQLQDFIKTLPRNIPILWLGLGSNLLVRDGGFAGVVISTLLCLQQMELINSQTIRAEAGVACAKLARFCARSELSGGEFWAGIPGSVGGALAMNAGCHGSETWEYVYQVETIDRNGQIHTRKPEEFHISYRHCEGINDEAFIAAHFRLNNGDKEMALEKIRQLLEHRAATQPTGDHSCGSVFRNPKNDFAGRLIESSGLKGKQIGGAQVSPKHANFIVNLGNASANDIESLIDTVANEVKNKHGIELIREVKIVGEK